MKISIFYKFGWFLLLIGFTACNPTKFLQKNETMLRSVKMTSDNKSLKVGDYRSYVRQEPNARWFSLLKVPLAIYSISQSDTTRRAGRFFRRIGQAPVVYDSTMAEFSRRSLEAALQAKGYIHASVHTDVTTKKRKTDVIYHLQPGRRYYVANLYTIVDDKEMQRQIDSLSAKSLLYKGMPFDATVLSEERSRIIAGLLNAGYYRLQKDYVKFRVDTVSNDMGVDLTMTFSRPVGVDSTKDYERFTVRRLDLYEGSSAFPLSTTMESQKALSIDGFSFQSDAKNPLRTKVRKTVYLNHIRLRPDSLYRELNVQDSYSMLNSLPIVSYSSIRFQEVPGSKPLLDADIQVVRNKLNSISSELEGTNTNGDLGAAVALTYTNRNLFQGAEALSLKLRGAYEAIRGLEGYKDENYLEYSAELSLRFPATRLPFSFRRGTKKLMVTSGVSFMYDSQNRLEFHRRVLTGDWAFRWRNSSHPGFQHRLDMISLNYVFVPWISSTFRRNYLDGTDPRNSILRASYEDLFIMRWGYSFIYNSQQDKMLQNSLLGSVSNLTRGWQLKYNIESAGNLLRGMSALIGAKKNRNGQYEMFNIAYSQYIKTDVDFVRCIQFDERNSLAFHAAFGIAIPYGNSSIIPYEKRYFAGGANSVRGWAVRGLGPGSYAGKNGEIDFIKQTGNIKLDLSAEWRTHLFWKLDGAAFVDAGNIWNTRDYINQDGGKFKFSEFYKQIAVAYGIGFRFNLSYFILRFDLGMKAINPVYSSVKEHYPIIRPRLSRDIAFHFAVGLPF